MHLSCRSKHCATRRVSRPVVAATAAECSPAELQARLADPVTKPGAKEMVGELQRRLSEYVGLMRVRLAGPEATLEVLDLEGASLSSEQAAALCARAMR